MELNTLIRIQCYKQAAPPGLKKNKQPYIDSLNGDNLFLSVSIFLKKEAEKL